RIRRLWLSDSFAYQVSRAASKEKTIGTVEVIRAFWRRATQAGAASCQVTPLVVRLYLHSHSGGPGHEVGEDPLGRDCGFVRLRLAFLFRRAAHALGFQAAFDRAHPHEPVG